MFTDFAVIQLTLEKVKKWSDLADRKGSILNPLVAST